MSHHHVLRSFCTQAVGFALALLLLGAASAPAQESFEANSLIVKFTPAAMNQLNITIENGVVRTGLPAIDALNVQHQARDLKRVFRAAGKHEGRHAQFGLTRYYKFTFAAGADVEALARLYGAAGGVLESAQPNFRYQLFEPDRGEKSRLNFTPNDPSYPTQWHYNNTGQTGGTPDADIDLPEAWDIETGDPSVIVSDLDTGQDLDHPDLAANIWINTDEIAGNNIDDDNNGYIDDRQGWDFSDGDNNPDDYHDHGSHTMGTVAALTNNGVGVAGIAFTSKVMACKIFPNAVDAIIADAFTYAADNGSKVSTNSWGGGSQSNLIEDAIDYYLATTNGVVVFAAGNSNSSNPAIGYPASYAPVMAVAATDHTDKKASFSNYGTWVDMSAPGVNVYSTVRNTYASFNGTSMACPHVAGVAALIFAKTPSMTGAQVRAQLQSSTDNIDALNPGFAGLLGTGRLNASKALGLVFPNPPTNLQGSVAGNNVTLTWTDPTLNSDGSPISLANIRVYRNGTQIAQVNPGVQTYLDAGAPNGQHSYHVTAMNTANVQSSPSNTVTLIVGTIDIVIWKHSEVTDVNVAKKARQRGLSEEQVRALMAQNPESHSALQAALAANGKSSMVISDITTVDLSQFQALFVVLGVYPNNHVVDVGSAEAAAIENYLSSGGKVFMESAEAWYYDPTIGGHDFGPSFGLDGAADGSGDLTTVLGVNGTITQGMNFTYTGQNNYIDRIIPVGNGVTIHTNQSPVYNCGVSRLNSGTGARTIGTAYEFGGLNDNSASSFTKANLMAQYLQHLGLGGPSQPSLSINDATVTEGNTGTVMASFSVSISAASSQVVTVNYATANNTATAGSDYVAASGTVTFPANTTAPQTIAVTVNGDLVDEPNETFFVNLSNPTNATISGNQGLGTITDNDPTPTISINDVTVTEGNTGTVTANFSVTLSGASSQAVTVNYATANGTATAGSDYVAASGTKTFPANSTTPQTIAVTVNGDLINEPNETFFVNLSNATNATIADNQGLGTINNDDVAPPTNLALNKPATASSSNSGFPPSNANDGSATTHWRSGSVGSSTVVWWRVDLGATYNINNVVIDWRGIYYATKYTVQVSLTGSGWTTVYTDNAGNGGIDNVTFAAASARYVRVRMTQNNSSTERINEVAVYAAASALAKSSEGEESEVAKSEVIPDEITLQQNYPNPFSANGTFGNPSTQISYSVPGAVLVTLKIYNLAGQEVATLVDEIRERGNYTVTFDASRLTSGVYFSFLQAGEVRQVRRLVYMK